MAAISNADAPLVHPGAGASHASDAELPDEIDRLYAEHFDFVWRSLRRLGVRSEELDDAAQDVFIVLLRRRAEFKGHSSHRTWLFGIANNVSHEYRRKRERAGRMTPVNEDHLGALHDTRVSPLEQASSAQALRFVDAFLASLDEDKRNVFILAELEQMSAPEIASALSVKPNTVYSRLRAARQAFSEILKRHSRGAP